MTHSNRPQSHHPQAHPDPSPPAASAVSCCAARTAPLVPSASAAELKDPVCGMTVRATSPHVFEHEGRPVHFCSAGCRTKFAADPARFSQRHLSNLRPATKPAIAGATYTCPMHPEVRQAHPGDCPKCGMALEPERPSLDEDENPELADFRRRFLFTLPLTLAVFVLAMFGHRLQWFEMATQSGIEMMLSIPVVLWAGLPFLRRGLQSITSGNPNMWTLVSLGTSAAFVYSLVATVAPGLFPDAFVSMGRVAVYFEAAAVIISLTLFGQMIELRHVRRPRPRSGPCSDSCRRPRAASTPTAARMTCRCRRFRSANGCACVRARRSRSMAWSLTVAAQSTSPC